MTVDNGSGGTRLVLTGLLALALAGCSERDEFTVPLKAVFPEYFVQRAGAPLPDALIAQLPPGARAAHLAGLLVVNLDGEGEVAPRGLALPQTPIRRERLLRRREGDPWVECTYRLSDAFRWRSQCLRSLGLQSFHPAGRPFLEVYWPAVDLVDVLESSYAREWARALRSVASAKERSRHREEAIRALVAEGSEALSEQQAACRARIDALKTAIRQSRLRQFGAKLSRQPLRWSATDDFLAGAYIDSEVVHFDGQVLVNRAVPSVLERVPAKVDLVRAASTPGVQLARAAPDDERWLSLADALGVVIEVEERFAAPLIEAGFFVEHARGVVLPGRRRLILAEYLDSDRLLSEVVDLFLSFERKLDDEIRRLKAREEAWFVVAREWSATSKAWAEMLELLEEEARLGDELRLQDGLRELMAEEPLLPDGVPGRVARELGR